MSVAAMQQLEKLGPLVDPIVGIVKYVHALPAFPGENLHVHIAGAEFQDPYLLPPRHRLPRPVTGSLHDRKPVAEDFFASGAAFDRADACLSAIGEALERYSLRQYSPEELAYGRARDLPRPCVGPDTFIRFSDEQYNRDGFAFTRYAVDDRLSWVIGHSLVDGGEVFLPAADTFIGFRSNHKEPHYDLAYSTGAGAGPELDSAILSGLCELIERDAFSCFWLTHHTPAALDVSTLLREFGSGLESTYQLDKPGYAAFDLTTDIGVPVVLAMIVLPERMGVAVGAACRPTLRDAARKALLETFQSYFHILDHVRSSREPPTAADIRDFNDHIFFYRDPDNLPLLDFLFAGSRRRVVEVTDALRDPQRAVGDVVQSLVEAGYAPYFRDITAKDLTPFPVKVVRAFAPGLQPLSCFVGYEHLDTRRLAVFCDRQGIPLPTQLNLDVHPFP